MIAFCGPLIDLSWLASLLLPKDQISRALRNVLINDLLDCARREHRNWCWNHVRAAREKERQTAIVNMADIRRCNAV